MLFAQMNEPLAVRGLDLMLREFVRENWLVLLPCLFGVAGVYLLLPRVKRISPALGGALAGIGLVLAALWWTRYETIWIEQLLFYIFAGLAVLGAGLMLSQHNPVHAALSFALVVLSSCGLFLLLAAPFLMAATIIIYAGAIVVTFLFVIMLAQQAGISNADLRSREPFLGSVAGFLLLGGLAVILHRGYSTEELDAVLGKLGRVAKASSIEEVNQVLGDPAQKTTLDLKEDIEHSFPNLKANPLVEDKVSTLEAKWSSRDLEGAQKAATELLLYGNAVRVRQGSLAGPRVGGASDPEKGDEKELPEGVDARSLPPALPRPLPAANVAALGKTLFTDYLIAVEMAGVLLLVATIGAIVIASRKTEGLR